MRNDVESVHEQRPPHHAVRALAVLMIGTMLAVGCGLTILQRSGEAAATAIAADRRASDAVGHTARDMLRAQRSLDLAAAADLDDERAVLVLAYQQHRQAAGEQWETYLDNAGELPGEDDGRRGFESARRSWLLYGDSLATTLTSSQVSEAQAFRLQQEAGASFDVARDHLHALVDEVYAPSLEAAPEEARRAAANVRLALLAALAVSTLVAAVGSRSLYRQTRDQWEALHERDEQRARAARSAALERRLQSALELSEDEPATLRTIEHVLAREWPDASTALLVADASDAHLERKGSTGPDPEAAACGVTVPGSCPAVRRATSLRFDDSTAFETCPHLRDRGLDRPVAATCVPVSVAGRTCGVVHSVTDVDTPMDEADLRQLEIVTARSGDRLGTLRLLEETHRRATTDSLTGLLNRASIGDALRTMLSSGGDVTVVFGDLDEFKKLNDTHGHATGDAALRTFAEVVRNCLRPSDAAGRWGGEEFLLLLPTTDLRAAGSVVSRLRTELATRLLDAAVPSFSCSFGIATRQEGEGPEDLIARADAALLAAKAEGRDCYVLAGGA